MNSILNKELGIIKLIFQFFLIIIVIHIPIVIGSTISFDLGGEPSYSLLIKTNSTQLNQKENFKIGVFISGMGDVNFSKISVSIPEYIVKDKIVKLTKINYTLIGINLHTNKKKYRGDPITGDERPLFWTLVPSNYYEYAYILGRDIYSGAQLEGAAPLQLGGALYSPNSDPTYYAPITIEFVVADNAPPGDHNIQITYSYKNKDQWYQDKQDIKIHINRFYETDEFYKITAVFTLLSFIVLIIQLIKEFKSQWIWISRLRKWLHTICLIDII